MPFTISDFEDLVRLLREHPEWCERLRSVILPEGVFAPAQLVQEHDEAIRRIEQAVAELAELQRRADERFEAFREEMREGLRELRESVQRLTEAQKRTDEQMAEFREAQKRIDERFLELREAQQRTDERLSALSESTERRFAELREAQQRTDERLAALSESTERRFAELREAQQHTDEQLASLRAEFYDFRASTEQRFLELREAQQRTDERLSALSESTERRFAELREAQQRTDEQLASLRAEFYDFRASTEQRFLELREAQQRTDERLAALSESTERRFAELREAQQHTDEQLASLRAEFYDFRASTEQRFDRLESRVDNLYSEVGRLTNIIGASLEEEAQASVAALMRQKGFKAPAEGYPVRLDGAGEIDVVLPVETPDGEKLTVVAESKARLSRRAVLDWANRMHSSDFRRRLKEAGVPGPYLVYTYAIRVDPAALDAAREAGIGVMSGRGVLVEPREPLPEA
ncbi:MAG: hypothetical protein KatS3mg023_0012 [Armatimonadota bacterium]|nr:MAG: hypothetical protein KatS3mg023_0012 [Armatimonadota bacterium]